MFQNKKLLSIIPARAGSKRLPKKNIKPLGDKPLITWSIEASLDSEFIDTTLVSTDCEEIAMISKNCGAAVEFLRPDSLAKDDTKSVDVIIHAVEFLKNMLDQEYDYVLLLQPTSPFRTSEDIDNALKYMFEKNADALVSVTNSEHSPLWANTLEDDDNMEHFLPENLKNSRSQDLKPYYRLNGAIYICDVKKLLEEKTFFLKKNIYAFRMSQLHSVDIDTKLDFLLAQTILTENINE